MTVAITRRDVSVGGLRREAGQTRDAKTARRMLAITYPLYAPELNPVEQV